MTDTTSDRETVVRQELARLRAVQKKRGELEAEWLVIAARLRQVTPPVPYSEIGKAAGMSDVGVINALRRAGLAAPKR